jgi:uncharacterized protein (DUF934 family)
MGVIVTDRGFVPDAWADGRVLPFEELAGGGEAAGSALAVDFPNHRDPAELAPWLERLEMIRIAFPAMSDGRGFSIARRLRDMGYRGCLRAKGPLVADQYRAARRVGFDEVELPKEVALRQPSRSGAGARARPTRSA